MTKFHCNKLSTHSFFPHHTFFKYVVTDVVKLSWVFGNVSFLCYLASKLLIKISMICLSGLCFNGSYIMLRNTESRKLYLISVETVRFSRRWPQVLFRFLFPCWLFWIAVRTTIIFFSQVTPEGVVWYSVGTSHRWTPRILDSLRDNSVLCVSADNVSPIVYEKKIVAQKWGMLLFGNACVSWIRWCELQIYETKLYKSEQCTPYVINHVGIVFLLLVE